MFAAGLVMHARAPIIAPTTTPPPVFFSVAPINSLWNSQRSRLKLVVPLQSSSTPDTPMSSIT